MSTITPVKLTPRECDILTALEKGRRYKEIASELGIALETVRHHVKNLYRKLKVNSRREVMLKITGKAMVEPES